MTASFLTITSQNTFMEGARLDIEASEDPSDPLSQAIFLYSIEVEMLDPELDISMVGDDPDTEQREWNPS